ncbi:Kelch repeat-containing protein [Flavitalea flava]
MNYTQNGNWVSRATFAGIPMGFGASFVLGNNAYVATGYNPNDPNNRLDIMFRYTATAIPAGPTGYDSAYGAWKQMTSFPGGGRQGAVAFSIGNLGYLGSGTKDGHTPLSDFYAYDPSVGEGGAWTAIDSLGTSIQRYPRFDASAFGLNNAGYVLTGTDNNYYFGDVWKYDPGSNTWSQLTNMPGSPRSQALTWIYNGKGYLVTGYTPGSQWAVGNACYDFWKFDPSLPDGQSWTRLRDIYNTNPSTYDDAYTNIARYHAAGFVITGTTSGDKGYITTGENGTLYSFTWEYDFASDLWTEKTPYEGAARRGAVGFTIQNRGFIATGLSGAGFNDCREFFPNQIYNQYD